MLRLRVRAPSPPLAKPPASSGGFLLRRPNLRAARQALILDGIPAALQTTGRLDPVPTPRPRRQNPRCDPMKQHSRLAVSSLALVALMAGVGLAADNELTTKEKEAGWILLFDGKSLDGWMTSSEKPSQRPVEENALNPHKCGGYMLIHKEVHDNFRLALDFKLSKSC